MSGDVSQELQFIVDRMNEPPFQMNLTMVAFDEKSPFELLEVVNEVMAQLSSQHRTDLRDETPEATATRMLDFLRVLNYKIVSLCHDAASVCCRLLPGLAGEAWGHLCAYHR